MNGKWIKLIILAAISFVFLLFLIVFVVSFISNSNSNSNFVNSNKIAGVNNHYPSPSPSQYSNSNTTTSNSVTPTPTPPSQNLADRIRSEMNTGNIVYESPVSMNLDDTKTVDMILGPNKTISELEDMIPDKQGKLIQNDKVQWYGYMEADLLGSDFDITPITPAKQLVSQQSVTKWSWSIKPKKPGKQILNLTLYALVDENGSQRALVIRPFDPKVIEVDVTMVQRLGLFFSAAGTHMGWILTALISIIFPFVVWLWKWIKGKRKKSPSKTKKNRKKSKPKSQTP